LWSTPYASITETVSSTALTACAAMEAAAVVL